MRFLTTTSFLKVQQRKLPKHLNNLNATKSTSFRHQRRTYRPKTTTSRSTNTNYYYHSIKLVTATAACYLVASTTTYFSSTFPFYASAYPTSSSYSSSKRYSSTQLNMANHITTRDGKGLITVAPRDESKQSALVVISHGLGDSAEGFVDVAEFLSKEFPYCKFVLPTAPTQPVTMNMGMPMPSWYDIVGMDERSNEECKGILESKSTILSILQKEHESNGLAYKRMVLMGFSQGGALSLFTGLGMESKEQKLAGIVCLSGYLAASKKFQLTEGLEDTPIFHGHGMNDPMVVYSMATSTQEKLQAMGVSDYKLKGYPGMVHTVIPEEIQHVAAFLKEKIPEDADSCVRVKEPSEMSVKELKTAIRNAGLGSRAVGLMEKSEFVKLLQEYRSNGN